MSTIFIMAIAIVLIIMFYILKAKPNGQGQTQNKAHAPVWSAAEMIYDGADLIVCLFVYLCSLLLSKSCEGG